MADLTIIQVNNDVTVLSATPATVVLDGPFEQPSVEELRDTIVSSPETGHVLQYNASSNSWENDYLVINNVSQLTFPLGGFTTSITSYKIVLSTNDPEQVIDSSETISARYQITATDGNDYEITELIVVVSGESHFFTEIGKISSSGDDLSAYSMSVVDGNLVLYASPENPNTTYLVVKTHMY